jgi:hypothetical protein
LAIQEDVNVINLKGGNVMRKKLNGALNIALAACLTLSILVPLSAHAANKLIVKDATGTTDKFVVTDSGYVGVGQNAPTSAIHAIGVSSPRDAQLLLQYNPATGTATGGGGVLLYYNNNSTLPSPGDRLGYIYFGSYSGTAQRNAAGIRAFADGSWDASNMPSGFLFETTPPGTLTRAERVRITSSGYVGIGTNGANPTSILQVVGLPVYANNAAAVAGGLTAGAFYRTGADPDVVCVVH